MRGYAPARSIVDMIANLPPARDVSAAGALAVVVVAGTVLAASLQGLAVGAPTVVVCLVAAGAWSWHRSAPLAAAVVVVATVAAYVVLGQPIGPIMLVVALACFAIGRHRSGPLAAGVSAAAAFVLAAAVWTRLDGTHGWGVAAILVAWPGVFVVVPCLAGALVRIRGEAAVRARRELLAAGAYEERLRVAREVHDIAGHGFAVVAMQAGVALTVFDERPGSARTFLENIRSSSERALQELQATLDVTGEPGTYDVPALVERVRAGGLPVELTVHGAVGDLDLDRSAAVYRVVQEALTNVVRHAGGAAASVTIDHGPAGVSVSVADRGPGGGPAGHGHGLRGLRQRVERLGGEFTAADRRAGGFEVVATLPDGGGR